MTQERDDYIRFRLPESLKEKLKLYSFIKKVSMTTVIIDLVTQKLAEEDLGAMLQEYQQQSGQK